MTIVLALAHILQSPLVKEVVNRTKDAYHLRTETESPANYTSIFRVCHLATNMAGNFLVGCMTAAREYSLCTIGWAGEIASLTMGPVCPLFERLRRLVLNLVCSIAETKTAFLSLGVIVAHFAGFIEIMLQGAVMAKTNILKMKHVTIYSTIINFKCLNKFCFQARGERNKVLRKPSLEY